MRLIVMGQQAFGKDALAKIIEAGVDQVVAVYCEPDRDGKPVDPIKVTFKGKGKGPANAKKRKLSDKLLRRKKTKEQKTQYAAVEQTEQAQLLLLDTKKPEWSEKLQAWTLNFAGRVKAASKRNFMLVIEQDNAELVSEFGSKIPLLRFGKISKDRYALDFQYPLSPVQALGIALTTFASKLMVT